MSKYIGIDFGTSNSAIVEYTPHRGFKPFRLIGDYDGNPIPSVIAIDSLTRKVRYGREVKDNVIELISKKQSLVIESVKTALTKNTSWSLGNSKLNSVDIATELFRALHKKYAEDTGSPVSKLEAVVAIPVGFDWHKRKAIRQAADRANIQISTFISEPTAAFMAHAKDLQHCRYVAVFDWGGGTLDISILEIEGPYITERQTSGWNRAGDFIDRQFAEWIHHKIAEEEGVAKAFGGVSPRDQQILLNKVERAKRTLQEEAETTINMAYLGRQRNIPVHQHQFDELIQPIVTEAVTRLLDCVTEAGIPFEQIGKLIVVGGSSKLNLLQDLIRRQWPSPNVLFPDEADWDVAKGASILAANPGSYCLAESIGLILSDNQYHPIFRAETRAEDANLKLHVGLVEEAESATFVFAIQDVGTRRAKTIGSLSVDVFGFRDEIIELRSLVTAELSFVARARSQSKDSTLNQFEYNQVRWMYEIPLDQG